MEQIQPIQVLLIENDQKDARRLAQMLRAAGSKKFRLKLARSLSRAQPYLQAGATDVALLGLSVPDAEGLDGVNLAQQSAPGLPLVVLSKQPDDSLATQALRLGAQDFLVTREITEVRLARSLRYAIARQHAQASLRTLSLIDELTALHNRRGFITLAGPQLKLAARRGLCSSLVFVDVDQLKYVNDTFGHLQGDKALQDVAQAFRECFRESDIIARFGGDEFCALLTDASESSAMAIRQRLCRRLDARNARPGSVCTLSVSVGIIEIDHAASIEHQLARADAQMYAQKRKKQKRAQGAPHEPTAKAQSK